MRELALRHVAHGVQDHDDDTVGAALSGALGDAIGQAWTFRRADAWAATYGEMAGTMRDTARTALVAAA